MKQKLFISLFLILMVVVLAGLNAASYTQKVAISDSEAMPNRSTFNTGATGTQAFYLLLVETGRKATRWEDSPSALLTKKNAPTVFVVIGSLRREFTGAEIEDLLRWVSGGGRLVLIDREPPREMVMTTANWQIVFAGTAIPDIAVDPADQKQMTEGADAIKAIQPSVFTQSVNAVQPSRFASSINIERFADNRSDQKEKNGTRSGPLSAASPPPNAETRSEPQRASKNGVSSLPSPTPLDLSPMSVKGVESPSQIAPVVHFARDKSNLVVDAPFGNGRIVFLADPYIVSNGGIALVDNAQLALNLVAAGDGVVAFDEYHQGYGSEDSRFLQFFEGTPVIAIFLQAALVLGLVFFSQSRRFARPVPEPEPDRLSKLEYVAAMAELQNRTHAYDLAIENIYNDFRRRVAKYFGQDNFTAKSSDLARLIAERTNLDESHVNGVLFKCEDIVRGEPTTRSETVELTDALRKIEQKLGIARVSRAKS